MNSAALLLLLALSCTLQSAAAQESFHGALQRGGAAHPSLYSFADLYRIALGGPAAGFSIAPANEAPMRTATAAAAPQFSISEAPEPQLGLLLLSGIALAVWVARRRLGYAF
jgi:hypothetical protein